MSQSIVNQLVLSYLGGALAFVSACFIPTLLGYLSFMVGSTVLGHRGRLGARVIRTSLLFGTGVSLLFAIGVIHSPVQIFLMDGYQTTTKIAGAAAMAFGLTFLSRSANAPLLRAGESTRWKDAPLGLPGAFIIGGLFGAVWPHCLGPILGAILNMSSVPWSAARGTSLLIVYALGLTSSFVVAGVALRRLLGFFLSRVSEEQRRTAVMIAGVILTAIGISLIFLTPWLAISRIFIGLANNSPTSRLEDLLLRLLQ